MTRGSSSPLPEELCERLFQHSEALLGGVFFSVALRLFFLLVVRKEDKQ
jgi:hypothetical protein